MCSSDLGASITTNTRKDPMFHGDSIRRAGEVYAGAASLRDPFISPIYGDLRGLPPLRLYVSDTEVLFDDSTRLAARARECGVEVDLRVWQGLPHVWPIFVAFGIPEARAVVAEVAAFLREPRAAARDERNAA